MRPNTRLTLVILLMGLALFGATALLASTYHRVRDERTQAHLAAGRAHEDPAAAVDEYRAALQLERDNPEAERALAMTLLELGRLAEAETYLNDLLRQFPTDGPLNRGLARIHAARGREADARAVYQRAIYGEWPPDAADERMETRFELIDYLNSLGAREDVLAELLRLKSELPLDRTAAMRRVADQFAFHGAPDLAIDTLTSALVVTPADVDLLARLGELQLSAGRSADARATLRRAMSLAPNRSDLGEQLQIVDRVLTLDPTLPNLRLSTRTRRARQVLSAVLAQTRPCETKELDEVSALRKTGAELLRGRGASAAEVAEQGLDLAVRLWAAAADCRTSGSESRALDQVLRQAAAATEGQA